MSLEYILRRVESEAGVTSPDLNPEQRARILDKINEACSEIYRRSDLPVVLRECYVRVESNMEFALPPFIGELRGIREGCCEAFLGKWTLSQMRPKYNREGWEAKWNDWEEKGSVPITIELTSSTPGTIVYPVIDEELEITIIGETDDSNRAVDQITIDAVETTWTKNFTSITAIRKNKITNYNVVIYDANANELATIYADQLEARYRVIDISKYPCLGSCSCSDGTYAIEILYKPCLPRLDNTYDTFFDNVYDDAIVLKTKQLLAEEVEGMEQRAILMHQKCELKLNQIENDKVGHIPKDMIFEPNPTFYDRQYIPSRRLTRTS
jgi:hypothetical protein